MWNLIKNDTNELIYKTETDLQISKTNMDTKGERFRGGIKQELGMNTHTLEYFSAIENEEIPPRAATWMHLEGIMFSEISQTEKDTYCLISHMWNLKKKKC